MKPKKMLLILGLTALPIVLVGLWSLTVPNDKRTDLSIRSFASVVLRNVRMFGFIPTDEELKSARKRIPLDAWGRSLLYTRVDSNRFVITSYGSDGVPGGEGEDRDLVAELYIPLSNGVYNVHDVLWTRRPLDER